MAPTLEPGNITVDLFTDSAEVADVLRPGDIVMYAWPIDTVKEFLHRVVGAPGDTLMMVGGVLHRNGRTEQEPYAWHEQPGQSPEVPEMAWMRDALVRGAAMASPRRNDWGPIVLPPGHWFVLGDNRDNALDSRYWGFVPTSHIRGRPQRSGER